MSKYYGDFLAGKKIRIEFNSVSVQANPATLSSPQWAISKNGVDVTPSGGVTLTVDVATVIGRNTVVIDMSADPATFTTGADYAFRLTGTSNVLGTSVSGITLGEWSVENRSVIVDDNGHVLLQSGTGAGQILLASGAVTTGTNADKSGYSLTVPPPTAGDITTAVLTTAMAESYAAAGVQPTLAQALYFLQQRVSNVKNIQGSIIATKLDGITTAFVLTTDAVIPPTQSNRSS